MAFGLVRTHPQAGQAAVIGPGIRREFDTQTCAHCNAIWVTRSNSPDTPGDPGGGCRQCGTLICPQCVGKGCTPLLVRIRQMEQRDVALRGIGCDA